MMKPRFFLSLLLVAVLFTACAPAASTTATTQPVNVQPTLTLPPSTLTAEPLLQATAMPVETLAPTPFPVVTSRGPHLEATDPTTVSMASGGLQFVEFFEFW
jgi:hypothetical protein